MSEAALGMRADLYGGASRGLFFEEAELEALALAGDGYVTEYVARDDGNTCSVCYRAQGFYLPGTRHPLPGRDCLGRNRCRCTLRLVFDPVMAAQLRGMRT